MNSEISNVSKLVPMTVLKTVKPSDDKAQKEQAQNAAPVSLSAADSLAAEINSAAIDRAAIQEEKQRADKKASLELVRKAADEGNSLLQATSRNLEFKVDDSTQEVVVKVIDSETGDVVRQVPSEQILELVKRLKEFEGRYSQGAFVQDRA